MQPEQRKYLNLMEKNPSIVSDEKRKMRDNAVEILNKLCKQQKKEI